MKLIRGREGLERVVRAIFIGDESDVGEFLQKQHETIIPSS